MQRIRLAELALGALWAVILALVMLLTGGCGQWERYDGVSYSKLNWFLVDFDFDKLKTADVYIENAEATGKDVKSATGIGIISTETPAK